MGFAPGPEPVPLVAGVVTLPGAPPDAPRPSPPSPSPCPRRSARGGAAPARCRSSWPAGPARRRRRRGHLRAGRGGVDRLTPRLAPAGADDRFVLLRLDAAALATDLADLGARSPEQAALAAVGERLGTVRVEGTRAGRALRLRLAPEPPPTPPAELDRPPPAQ
ncbi:MAG: hypothetical protein H6704_06605 [Myxococcales bacterium]|nr:hypothetical protein [Myxococcales bacterium]